VAKRAVIRHWSFVIGLVSFVLLIPSILLNVYFFKNQNKPEQHEVEIVLDGDTFETKDHIRIRLHGLDAPEFNACGGMQAKKELEKLILGKKITFEAVTSDDYHRPVADVYLPDGKLVNVLLIQSGWAAYEDAQPKNKEAAKRAGEESRQAKRGIYSDECVQYENRQNPKCSIKGNANSSWKTKVYSFKGCSINYEGTAVNLAMGDQWFCSEKAAQDAGFVKAEKCFDLKFKE
jgi:micrococcal nuclease